MARNIKFDKTKVLSGKEREAVLKASHRSVKRKNTKQKGK